MWPQIIPIQMIPKMILEVYLSTLNFQSMYHPFQYCFKTLQEIRMASGTADEALSLF